jgi:STE24 endopeptidase
VADVYDEETYKKQMAYQMDNLKFSIFDGLIGLAFVLTLLIFNVHHRIYEWLSIENDYLLTFALFGVVFTVSFLIDMATSIYDTFVIEAKHGFNQSTAKTFILDHIKKFIISIVLMCGLMSIFILLYNWLGNTMFPIFYCIFVFIVFLITVIYPFFMKIFNKFTDLEEGELKTKIIDFVAKTGYKIDRIKVMDGSRRSKKGNAFMTGWGKTKTIVLYDTILNQMDSDEIVAVLAHELAHAKYRHIQLGFLMSMVSIAIFVSVAYFVIVQPSISSAFGFVDVNNVPIGFNGAIVAFGFFVLGIVNTPLAIIINIPVTAIQRKFEYSADKYAAENHCPKAMVNALKKLARENYANLTPHPFVVAMQYSHPPIDKRVEALERVMSYEL